MKPSMVRFVKLQIAFVMAKFVWLSHNHCEPCAALNGAHPKQSALHHLLECPVFKHERDNLLAECRLALELLPWDNISTTKLLRPSRDNQTNFASRKNYLQLHKSDYGWLHVRSLRLLRNTKTRIYGTFTVQK